MRPGRYEVHERRFGRPGSFLPNGQFWETDLPCSVWVFTSRHARKVDAIAAARAARFHAVVVSSAKDGGTVYDNGKPALDHRDFAPEPWSAGAV